MTEKFKNDDDEEVTDKAMDDDEDDTTEVIGQPHPRHQEPPARSPLFAYYNCVFVCNLILGW